MTRASCTARTKPVDVTRRAFTLVELIVVLVIISAIAGLALPAYGSAVARYRLDAAAYALSGELDRSAVHARTTASTVTIRFDTTNHLVEFDNLPDRRSGAATFTLDLREEPRDATLVSVNFDGFEYYSISGYGVPSTDGLIILRNTGGARRINVDAATAMSRVSR